MKLLMIGMVALCLGATAGPAGAAGFGFQVCNKSSTQVRVAAGIDAAANSRTALQLLIEDDGPGIAEVDRARVLVRGGRADEATPGHGLGLSMVHDTVALYGGAMQIDASPLGGARLELRLPGRTTGGAAV